MHYAWPVSEESLEEAFRVSGASAWCLAALPTTFRLSATPDVLAMKHRRPETTFALGCLDASAYGEKKRLGAYFVKYTEKLLAAGCDGVKLLEGKPTMRRDFPIPDFDDAAWEPFWSYAEQVRLPILWHLNDPASFWHAEQMPSFARSMGWGYGLNDVNNTEQYRQVRAVLERHERLNVTFAHMLFLSDDLGTLSEWMTRFPMMRVDLTPGIELYENLSAEPEQTRAFFDLFSERIQYGTDIGGRAALNGNTNQLDIRECKRRAEICRAFLTSRASIGVRSDGHFLQNAEPFVMHGLGLPAEMLQQIAHDNFLSFIGSDWPRAVNVRQAIRLCDDLARRMAAYHKRTGRIADYRAVNAAVHYFKSVQGEGV